MFDGFDVGHPAIHQGGGFMGDAMCSRRLEVPPLVESEISKRHGPQCRTRVKEQEARARGVFLAAHRRFKQVAAVLRADTAAQPFVAAPTELIQAQADTTGFVSLAG
ncbi:hypothetical protein [Streptomyces sp. NPDC000229]|uniref:hypothetical protein n=1 Tax=Streptomyces sp. NPDC000229 TaxID=3154247 RepID=UPI0033326046